MTLSNNRFITGSLSKFETETYNPILGFETEPLVSLEEAVRNIIPFVSDVMTHVKTAKEKYINDPNLPINEAAAIYLYTIPNSLYGELNKALRNEDGSSLKLWFPYLKLLLTGLYKLPSHSAKVWRGVYNVNASDFKENNIHTWWSITSCSKSDDFAGGFKCDKGVLFCIDSAYGKDITSYSAIPNEQEIILMPGTKLRVTKVDHDDNGISTINLTEW